MRIGVISDTHDNLPKIERAVEIFNERGVELVLHAGDFISPFTANAFKGLKCKLIGVFGNNDGEKFGLKARFEGIGEISEDVRELEAGGRRIVVMHKELLVEPLAKSGLYDLVVYGHTHKADVRRVNGTLVVNPGEAGGWLYGRSTIAVVDLERMEAEIIEI